MKQLPQHPHNDAFAGRAPTREELLQRYSIAPGLPDDTKVDLLFKGALADKNLSAAHAELREMRDIRNMKLRKRNAVLDLHDAWGFSLNPAPTPEDLLMKVQIQRNTCSRLHKLSAAMAQDDVLWLVSEYDDPRLQVAAPLAKDVQTFVINHDWSELLGDEALEGEFQLPYERCAFEFRVSNRTLIVLAVDKDTDAGGADKGMMTFYETKDGDWCNLGPIGAETWTNHIRTLCVMLEAEVAVRQMTRADHKLNVKREKKGELPLYDFHTIDISPRHRAAGLKHDGPAVPGSGRRKRLHFCRGHWRHYEDHKTWIRWCLKGDETLGFVDKNYRV